MINLKSDVSPVTNDLARVAAGRVLGPGQTVIWNTNTAGEIQWNRDGTFSVQISRRATRRRGIFERNPMDFLGTFSRHHQRQYCFSFINEVKYCGHKMSINGSVTGGFGGA